MVIMITQLNVDIPISDSDFRGLLMKSTMFEENRTRDRVVGEIMETGNTQIGLRIYTILTTELRNRFKVLPKENV